VVTEYCHFPQTLPIGQMSGIWLPGGCSCWLPADGFEALHSALQARKQMCSYLSLVHESLQRFDLAVWCFGMLLINLTAYNMISLRWVASEVTVTLRNMSSPYPIWGLKSLIGPSSLHRSFVFYLDYNPPWVDIWGGGRIGSSPLLAKVSLSA
jgi:hypothetical protein